MHAHAYESMYNSLLFFDHMHVTRNETIIVYRQNGINQIRLHSNRTVRSVDRLAHVCMKVIYAGLGRLALI